MVMVEIRILEESERTDRTLSLLERDTGLMGIDVVGGRSFPVEAPNWPSAMARLDDALTRVAGDGWRDRLAFVAPAGFEHPKRRGLV